MTSLFADAHCHSNPASGLGAASIARKFKSVGGWFIALVSLPSWYYGLNSIEALRSYARVAETHLNECNRARESGVEVACFVGLHPAEIDRALESANSYGQVIELCENAVKLIFKLCERGVIDGVGEIGRQHYKARPENIIIAQKLLERALELARDSGCKVQLHLENIKGFTAQDLSGLISRLNVSMDLILVHHASPTLSLELSSRGIWSTVPATREAIARLAESGGALVMPESDFLDDPRRPGAVLEPWAMAENFRSLREQSSITDEMLYKLNVDNIVRFFGVKPP
ncbi:MAG: TatD family hydrolase [Fervidicoccaceae archaeon]